MSIISRKTLVAKYIELSSTMPVDELGLFYNQRFNLLMGVDEDLLTRQIKLWCDEKKDKLMKCQDCNKVTQYFEREDGGKDEWHLLVIQPYNYRTEEYEIDKGIDNGALILFGYAVSGWVYYFKDIKMRDLWNDIINSIFQSFYTNVRIEKNKNKNTLVCDAIETHKYRFREAVLRTQQEQDELRDIAIKKANDERIANKAIRDEEVRLATIAREEDKIAREEDKIARQEAKTEELKMIKKQKENDKLSSKSSSKLANNNHTKLKKEKEAFEKLAQKLATEQYEQEQRKKLDKIRAKAKGSSTKTV